MLSRVATTFGQNLARLRKRVGISQEELARRIGVKRSAQISHWETGRRKPEPRTLTRLAAALDCEPWEFLKGVKTDYDALRATSPAAAPAPPVHLETSARAAKRYTDLGLQIAAADMPVFGALPLLTQSIGAGPALVITGAVETFLAFNVTFIRQFVDPVCLRVGDKEESMIPTILPGDLIVIDQDKRKRMHPKAGHVYAVNVDGGGTIKRIELRNHTLIVLADNDNKSHFPTELIDVQDVDLTTIIIGEVVWHARYLGDRR